MQPVHPENLRDSLVEATGPGRELLSTAIWKVLFAIGGDETSCVTAFVIRFEFLDDQQSQCWTTADMHVAKNIGIVQKVWPVSTWDTLHSLCYIGTQKISLLTPAYRSVPLSTAGAITRFLKQILCNGSHDWHSPLYLQVKFLSR
jgi:hypothetical protein